MGKETLNTAVTHAESRDIEASVVKTIGEDTTNQARLGAEAEHNLPPLEAIRKYPWTVFWCLIVSLCVIMEGFDTNLLSKFFAYPAFAQKYGHWNQKTNNYQLSAPWQAGLVNASQVGAFFGAIINGYLVTKYGHVRVLIGSLVALSSFIFIVFFAPNIKVLLAGEILCGFPWGIFATTAPAYASEILPMSLRNLARLRPRATEAELKDALGLIVYTNNLEEQLSVGTSYWDCFKGFELRRTEIAVVVFAGQILSGLTFAYNSTYFFQQIGLDSTTTYHLNVGGNGMALFSTLMSWICIMPHVGRRTTYLYGMFLMAVILFVIGALNTHTENHTIAMTQAVLTLVWTFIFHLSAGQLGWALPAEMGSTRLRQKTICLARNGYTIASICAGVLQPYFMNPTKWNLKGYTGFVWGSTALLVFIWSYFRLPETKNRTFEELDILFARGVPARKFSSYRIDSFNEANIIN